MLTKVRVRSDRIDIREVEEGPDRHGIRTKFEERFSKMLKSSDTTSKDKGVSEQRPRQLSDVRIKPLSLPISVHRLQEHFPDVRLVKKLEVILKTDSLNNTSPI